MRLPEVPRGNWPMEVTGGSCRLGLWYVHVWWSGDRIYRVRFASTGIPGPVPASVRKYCAGHPVDLSGLWTVACEGDSVSTRIYRAVREVPYGSTATYGEIARRGVHLPGPWGVPWRATRRRLSCPATASLQREELAVSRRRSRSKNSFLRLKRRAGNRWCREHAVLPPAHAIRNL